MLVIETNRATGTAWWLLDDDNWVVARAGRTYQVCTALGR